MIMGVKELFHPQAMETGLVHNNGQSGNQVT